MADAPSPSPPEPPSKRRWLIGGALALVALAAIGVIVLLVADDEPQPLSMPEWIATFEVESMVILDARTAMDEAAERSDGAASVRCEAILEDPAIETAIRSIANPPDGAIRELAAEWEATFRAAAEFCVADELDRARDRQDRADELFLLLGEEAGVDVDASGYDRTAAFDDLTADDFGFTDEQANCILDKVESQGLEDVVVEDDIDNVDPGDVEAVTDIFGECTLGDLFTDELDGAIDDAVDEELGSETG